MSCSKCEAKSKIEGIAKKKLIAIHDSNLLSRIVYEKLKQLESFSDAPAGEGGDFKACVEKMTNDGKSEESAKKICAEIGRRKYGKAKFQSMAAKGKIESNSCSGDVRPAGSMKRPEPKEILKEYESTFKEELALKMKPITNYGDIDSIRQQINRLEDKRYRLESDYRYNSGTDDPYPEETLVLLRMKARKQDGVIQENELNKRIKEFIGKNQKKVSEPPEDKDEEEDDEEDYEDEDEEEDDEEDEKIEEAGVDINELIGKTADEQLKILKKSYPEFDEKFIKELVGIVE